MPENWHWFVYIIECKDRSYYVGMTWCPEQRFEQHHRPGTVPKWTSRGVKYTKQAACFEIKTDAG